MEWLGQHKRLADLTGIGFILKKTMAYLTANEYLIIRSARKFLSYESEPWCEHWLLSKIQNNDRSNNKISIDLTAFDIALRKLIEKKFVTTVNMDRFVLNVEATRYIK